MKELVCIVCPRGCRLKVDEENGYSVSGNSCPRGEAYGRQEITAPVRTVTSTVRISGGLNPMCPVKTNRPVPKSKMLDVMREIAKVRIQSPVKCGDIIIKDVCSTGSDIVATKEM